LLQKTQVNVEARARPWPVRGTQGTAQSYDRQVRPEKKEPINMTINRRELVAGAAIAGAALAAGRLAVAAAPADLTRLSLAEAARRIAARELTSEQLTRAYLARIERLNPRINAYITVTADAAVSQARLLDSELAAGRSRGPLHGIPIALKDNIDTAGVLTSAASAVYADRIPTEDAPVVTKLRAAGAVLLGKLNMHEFAYGGTCVISHYGPIRNPRNLAHVPGGSSGGSAAAVAARLCVAALGTDTAASIRFPAACCGVVGLKATHGLASIRGIVPLSEMHDHVGPLARSVEDAAIVMDAIAGFDALDPVSIRAPALALAAGLARPAAPPRIGLVRRPFFEGLDPEISAAMDAAIGVLQALSAGAQDVELAPVDSYDALSVETYAYHATLLKDPVKRKLYHPVTLQRIESGAGIPATTYFEARRRMIVARNTVGRLFERVDLLVTPTFMRAPPTIEDSLRAPPNEGDMIRNTLPFNVYGLPTISVPCGYTRAGLPVGLQITGPALGEPGVLALAKSYEAATQWHLRELPDISS
jgi:aspartyl-tRNA(Asn)/glutamyl-tRNA(Gln) amidotransferase subunit A